METEGLRTLIEDIEYFFDNIKDGDKYIDGDPELEDGLQLDLYRYLKDHGYQVVYELSLPDLKPYLDKELNEAVCCSGFPKDSLRPDLVVNLEEEGFACFELKYNETDDEEIEEDIAKCRVYVKHCKDVHFAGVINLSKYEIKYLNHTPCEDMDYEYGVAGYWDDSVDRGGLRKSIFATPIRKLWEERYMEIENGVGKFADYE